MSFNFIIPGLGCKVGYGTSSGTYTNVGQLKSIGGTNWESVVTDSTGINSTAGEQVAVGLFKGGDYEFSVWMDPANTTHVALSGYVQTATLLYFEHVFSSPVGPGATAPGSPKKYEFAGYLSKFSTSGYESESGVEATFTVAITGPVTVS